MANEQDTNPNSEEYTYTEENYTHAFPVKKPNPLAGVFNKIKRQRIILVVIGVLIIIYIIYKISNAIQNNKSADESPAPDRPVTKAQTIIPVQQQPQQQVAAQQIAAQPLTQQDNAQNISLQMQNNLANIDARLYNIQQGLGILGQSMQRIESVLVQQLAMQRAEQQVKMANMQHVAAQTYTVYAVIPNRAWLLNAKGITLTVAPGSIIPGVGMVTQIDPVHGTVTTNTGILLRFAYADR